MRRCARVWCARWCALPVLLSALCVCEEERRAPQLWSSPPREERRAPQLWSSPPREERRAPQLWSSPPREVRYAAGRGVSLACAARGQPPPDLSWLDRHGAQIHDQPPTTRVFSNGTLVLADGAATVRCRAANVHGVALSADISLIPVADTGWEAVVSGAAVAAGGVAALRCEAAAARAVRWYRADTPLLLDHATPESRMVWAGGVLLIREARPSDAGPYSCLARHDLTATTKRSPPYHLAVTAGASGSAPRVVGAGEVSARAGASACLPCAASDRRDTRYTWYRELDGRLQAVQGGGGLWPWAGGAALCVERAGRAAAGAWLCKAYSPLGDATAQVRLVVHEPLTVTVTPPLVVVSAGSSVRLNCSASDPSAQLWWLHDGVAAGAGGALLLPPVARAHTGLYQCFARTHTQVAQASAELRLSESPPELQYTFIEQALRPGGAVSLRCAASAAPPPRFSWLLDGQPLDHYRASHRYMVVEERAANGDVASVLNVSSVAVGDGGRYTCRAENRLGRVEHSARLNIYGPPSIRALGPVRVVAGANATIYCPYAGYPISSVSWRRRGAGAALGGAGRLAARGASLALRPALAADAGLYSCAVAAPQAPTARADIEIQVRNPPKISPFIFSSELTEGSSVQVLCGVSSGDKPMYFSWLKDGSPLPPDLQIEEKSLNEFSLLMFPELRAQHSGAYTCCVTNHAATVNYTAVLSVKVPPAWLTEPLDAAVLLGSPLLLECAARGFPTPTLTWYRRIGETSSLSGEASEHWEPLSPERWTPGKEFRAGDGGVLRAGNGTLGAPAAARHHQGLYRCTADNGVGPPLLKQVNVTVHEPAHFEETGGNVSCTRGHGVSLSCHAVGDAPLSVHWSHGGDQLDLTSYRWTVSEARTAAGLRSTLQLRAAERSDGGQYRCHAHNQYGRSELLIHLLVEEPPAAPGRPRLGGVGPRWARLAWRAPPAALRYSALCTALHSLPAAEPTNHILNLTLEPAHDDGVEADGLRAVAARVEGLRPATSYSVRLAAANHVGQSPHSHPLLFTTLEEAPTSSPQNVHVRSVNGGELLVTWEAPPQESWNGQVLGYVVSWRAVGAEGAEGAGGALTARGGRAAAATLAGLRAAARYALAVRAYTRAGPSPPSPTVYATTVDGVPETPPRSVVCEAVSARVLRVRWAPSPAETALALRGYEVQYTPLHFPPVEGEEATARVRAGAVGEASLQGLRAATNYSVWVRARTDSGAGPPAAPVYCATKEDVPGSVEAVRALSAGSDAVRVSWLPPVLRAGRLTHYTLFTRELGKVGGEWAQRVEPAAEEGDEAWREVRGLREHSVYEFWVRAATAAGTGPPSRPVSAAPTRPGSARISSFSRVVYAVRGARVQLRCAAVGAPPLRRRWAPLPPAHTLTDAGDLVIHKVEGESVNYTCMVRNAGGADVTVISLRVRAPPAAPAPRLVRADTHALHLAWDPPPDGGAALLGYTVWWRCEGSSAEGTAAVAAGDTAHAVRGLACGALYRVTLRAHNVLGASPHSHPLLARTLGDKAKPPPGKEFVWANSTYLRLNLLAWGGRCPVTAWAVAVRPAAGGAWSALAADREAAQAGPLRPGTWYEIRVTASSPAGDTVAHYRAATRDHNGEDIGEAVEVTTESESHTDEGGGGGGAGAARRTVLAATLLAAGLAALLAALAGLALVRRRGGAAGVRDAGESRACDPHPQLYSTEPGKRNGKMLTPPDGELNEISPYATFSMSSSGGAGVSRGGGGCALHLRTFARAPSLELAAPPPRPNLLAHAAEYGRARESDSESSGSSCAACAAELYRMPAAHLADTLPAVESSAEDTLRSAAPRRRPRLAAPHRPPAHRSRAEPP